MRSTISIAILILVAALVPLAAGAGAASGAGSGDDGCSLVSTAQFASILGLQHVQIGADEVGKSFARNTNGVVEAGCGGIAWSGALPTSLPGALAAVRSGRAAVWAYKSFRPDDASDYVSRWTGHGYDTVSGGLIMASLKFPGLPSWKPYHAETLSTPGHGGRASGLTWLPVAGVYEAAAAWMKDSSYRIVGIAIAESPRRPVLKHLNQLAQAIVPRFGA